MSDATTTDLWASIQEQRLALLACELHDGPCQNLTSAMYKREAFRIIHPTGPKDAWGIIDQGLKTIQEGVSELRTLVCEMRPSNLDDGGLASAIENLLRQYTTQYAIVVTFAHDLQEDRLPPTVRTAVFRIVQESLSNIRRHSGSKHARLEVVHHNGSVHIESEDWGVGFDPAAVGKGCFGLAGIRTWAALLGGHVSVISLQGKGTLVAADIPAWGFDAARGNGQTVSDFLPPERAPA